MSTEIKDSKLNDAARKAFADTFAFFLKTAFCHWNVLGPDFYQYHLLFERIYTEVYDTVDEFAEHLRTLGIVTPGSLARLRQLTGITESTSVPTAAQMIAQLYNENEVLRASLNAAFHAATAVDNQGFANYIAERLDKHAKHAWMLRVSRGSEP
jgi:starvation-inducible DNA-binding protein